MRTDIETLLSLFIRHGVSADKFEISYAYGEWTIKIGDMTHCYNTAYHSFDYMLENTLVHYLTHKNCNCKNNKES